MNTKIRKIRSTAVPAPSRAQYGPATAGIEWDTAFNELIINPDGVRRRLPVDSQVPTPLSVNGAIPVRPSANYIITKAGVLADTLAAPTAGSDDGVLLTITSNTANAHTITATGLLDSGSAAVNLLTFAAFKGASVSLRAYQGRWQVVRTVGVTPS